MVTLEDYAIDLELHRKLWVDNLMRASRESASKARMTYIRWVQRLEADQVPAMMICAITAHLLITRKHERQDLVTLVVTTILRIAVVEREVFITTMEDGIDVDTLMAIAGEGHTAMPLLDTPSQRDLVLF